MLATSFNAPTAAKVAHISMRMIQYWARTGLILPSVAPGFGRGHGHRYNWSDVVALRVVKQLRDSGISLQALRTVVERLKAHEGASFSNLYLTGVGKQDDVALIAGDDLISLLRRPGQMYVAGWILNVGQIEAEVRTELEMAA